MSEVSADPWRAILQEALATNPPPVVGTHFRSAVDTAAAKHELRFPPAGQPVLRFIQLLERYPDVVSILRRPGQDFLVAPSDRADLLAKGIQDRFFGIRNDLFQAFTIISENQAFYDKALDRVVWKEPVEGQTSPDSLVPIDPATLSSEIQLRGDFIATIEEPLRSQLSKTLEDSRPLQTFGKVVQETQLNILWHSFRTKRVLEKIQRWASEKKVEWKDAWLTQGRTVNRGKEREFGLPAPSGHLGGRRTEGDPLHLLFSGLDAADIQRISIPLDLVLKVLSARKKP